MFIAPKYIINSSVLLHRYLKKNLYMTQYSNLIYIYKVQISGDLNCIRHIFWDALLFGLKSCNSLSIFGKHAKPKFEPKIPNLRLSCINRKKQPHHRETLSANRLVKTDNSVSTPHMCRCNMVGMVLFLWPWLQIISDS